MGKKVIFCAFVFILFHFVSRPVFAQSAIGSCGGVYGSQLASGINANWSYFSGFSSYWSTLEPVRGQFTFNTPPTNPATGQPYKDCSTQQPYKTLQQLVDAVPTGQKVWLQVVTDTGACPKYATCNGAPWPETTTIPQWTINAGVPSLFNPEANFLCNNNPSQWDPKYRELLQEMLTAFANQYDNNPKVEAYLMMSGGLWGEMSLPYHAYNENCDLSIRDPRNIWVKEMARIWLGNADRANELLLPCNGFGYCFDYYYVESVKKLIDMYATTFKKPVVLQLGNGASCRGQVSSAVAEYATKTYGSKVWLKQNGWGNPTSNFYYGIFNQYKTKTRIIEEVGQPSYWTTLTHNDTEITNAINNGVSAACFYTEPLRDHTKYPIDWVKLNEGLVQNYNNLYAKIPTPTGCLKSNGDADGDNLATISDFEIWRREFLKLVATLNSNFDCDQNIDIDDFGIWKNRFFVK